MAWLAAQGVADARLRACAGRRGAAVRAGASPTPACRRERSVLARRAGAAGSASRRSRSARASRPARPRRAQGAARGWRGLADRLDGRPGARSRPAGRRAAIPTAARDRSRLGAAGGADRAVSLSSNVAGAACAARASACSRASSPRRCCSSTDPFRKRQMASSNSDRFNGSAPATLRAAGRAVAQHSREGGALRRLHAVPQGRRHLHPDRPPIPARRGSVHAAVADGRSATASRSRARWSGSRPKASRATARRASASSSRRTRSGPPRARQIEKILGETLASNRPTHTM